MEKKEFKKTKVVFQEKEFKRKDSTTFTALVCYIFEYDNENDDKGHCIASAFVDTKKYGVYKKHTNSNTGFEAPF